MMKLLLPLTLMLAFSVNALAYDFKVNGLCYNKRYDNTVMVTFELEHSSNNYKNLKGNKVIPTQVTFKGISYAVTRIDNWAFAGCAGLTSVTIPNSVTEIGKSAFEGCTGLTSVTIPNSVTEISYGAFQGCTGLASINVDPTNTTFDSRENCNAIIETATNTLVVGCKNTQIPTTVKTIGADAFAGCTGMTAITIPNSVTWIDANAFEGCTGLTSMTIPNSVTTISIPIFKGCTNLASINVESNPGFDSRENCNAIILTSTNTLIAGCKNTQIPTTVETISEYAFDGCTSLKSVTIPNSVTEIGRFAFEGCTSLTSVTIPNSMTEIDNGAFYGCTSLTSVTIPNSVIEVCRSAFEGCTSLKSVTIPNSVTKIGHFAFYRCTGLKSVTIPNSVTEINYGAFQGCTDLVSINVDPTNTTFDSRENCNAIIETATNTLVVGCKNTQIPTTVTTIGENAFDGCTGLKSVTIPNSVTEIGSSAFYGCTGLKSVIIPNSVTEIGSSAFDGCTGLKSVTIPNSVTEVSRDAFSGCTKLVSINVDPTNTIFDSRENCNAIIETATNTLVVGCKNTQIPTTVKTIGENAFDGCTGLRSVTIPNSVTEINYGAFYGCTGLKSVTIPNSVTEIGSSAFDGCTGLKSVTIPNSVTEINYGAFYGCTGLKSVIIPNSVTEIGSSAFYGCTGLRSVTIPNSVTEISEDAYRGCTSLTSVTIPNSVTEIGSSAFYGCTGLKSVTIPNSVTEIGSSAFYGCTGLKSVTIPNSVTEIGSSAFYGCTGLKSVTIPNSVTEISEDAYRGCTSLTSVTIPNSVIKIGSGAFENCINLESIVCWIKDPKTISTDIDIKAFMGVNRQKCKLLIPRSSFEIYSSVAPWRFFTRKDSIAINDIEAVEQKPLSPKQEFQQYYNKKQYSKAIQIGELLNAIDEDNILLIEQLADCYYEMKNYSKAKKYYEILDTTFTNINENDSYETAFRNERLGDCCMETNDYANAEIYYKKAYQNYSSCDSLNVRDEVVNTLYDLYCCYIAQGKLLKAIDPYLERQSLLKQPYQNAAEGVKISDMYLDDSFVDYDNLSRILKFGDDLCNQNRYDEALKIFVAGILLYQKIKGEQNREVAVMYERAGRCYFMMQQYAQAQNYLNLSKKIFEKEFRVSIHDYVDVSDVYMNDINVFFWFYQNDLDDLILDYGLFYASLGYFIRSYPYLRKSLDHIHDNSIDFFGDNTSAERSAYWEKNSYLFCKVYPYVVLMAADEHFNRHNNEELNYSDLFGDLYNKSALFAKGLLLTSDNEFSRIIYESGDSTLISAYMELDSLRNLPGPLTDEQRMEIAEKSEELEKELIVVSKDYRKFMDNLQLKWKDVQARLRPNDIAIEFLSFPKLGRDGTFYVALILRKDYDSLRLAYLFEENELQAAAQKAYTSNELSKLIWEKLSSEFNGVDNIYFSPSGALHQIAIESMPHWENADSMMSECFNIYRLSSTRELAIDRDNIQSHTAAVYGDIEYNTKVDSMGTPCEITDPSSDGGPRGFDADAAGYRGKTWKDLAFTKAEVDSITAILMNKEIDVYKRTQTAATETTFKALSKQTEKKNIIHIATHGFCWNDSVAREENRKSPLSFMGEGLNAMTRTGLLFSGANHCFKEVKDSSDVIPDGVDDGVLTAYEVSRLDLRDLDLLVLSACETGLGEVSPEGVFGLQRGFKKAGARSIIMSLWTVNDLATSEMMTKFYYYHFTEGMTKREAFLKAQQYLKDNDYKYKYDEDKKIDKKMRATRPHWAAFILLDALDNR